MQRSLFAPDPPTMQASRAAIIALLKARQAEMQAMIEAILAGRSADLEIRRTLAAFRAEMSGEPDPGGSGSKSPSTPTATADLETAPD